MINLNNLFNKKFLLGIGGYPFSGPLDKGPNIFFQRLVRSIKKQGLVRVGPAGAKWVDMNLYKVFLPDDFYNPFCLRVDGIYVDYKNTFGDTDDLNAMIFDSIDKAKGVIFVSDFCRTMVESFKGPLRTPYIIIHNAVNLQEFSPYGLNYRRELGIKGTDRVLLVSAWWRRFKRLREAVQVFRDLKRRSSHNYKLIVLGRNIDYLCHDQDILCIGEVRLNQLPAWYRTAGLYLHTASLEPCANTLVEAMACGLPAVVMRNGGNREIVEKIGGGIVSEADEIYNHEKCDLFNFPAPDYQILASDIEKIFDNYGRYKSQINYSLLDIDRASRDYVRFIKEMTL